MNKKGMKFDDEKLKWSLLPIESIEEEIKCSMVGAEKYDINNWKKVEDAFVRYINAIMRHMAEIIKAISDGVDPMSLKDADTGLHPLAHIACDAHFALWFVKKADMCDNETWKIKINEIRQKYNKERNEHADKK